VKVYLKKHPTSNWLLMWRTAKGRTWYPINEKNIVPISNSKGPEGLRSYREAMNRLLHGEMEQVLFDGLYVKTLRVLALEREEKAA